MFAFSWHKAVALQKINFLFFIFEKGKKSFMFKIYGTKNISLKKLFWFTLSVSSFECYQILNILPLKPFDLLQSCFAKCYFCNKNVYFLNYYRGIIIVILLRISYKKDFNLFLFKVYVIEWNDCTNIATLFFNTK